ncbi:MAG TPA: hypothetical protein VN324_04205, partial [Quisquiliibacterium sp.]|nr:hypothetical protein [Quisquiliibacterium sp.]
MFGQKCDGPQNALDHLGRGDRVVSRNVRSFFVEVAQRRPQPTDPHLRSRIHPPFPGQAGELVLTDEIAGIGFG